MAMGRKENQKKQPTLCSHPSRISGWGKGKENKKERHIILYSLAYKKITSARSMNDA